MTVLANAHVVTMDDAGTELAGGWILIEDGLIAEVGSGTPPEMGEDLAGAVVTPALINTHHHLFQTLTRARAQEADLFTWLKELYPVWARLDAEAEYAAARAGLAELALSGCGTVFDHHYVFPRGEDGLIEAELQAARERRLQLRLHTHLAETVEEEAYCHELYGCRPVEYLESLGWLAVDVWCAHCVHLDDGDIRKVAASGTGVAHCPTSNLRLGAGVAPVRELLDADVRVGLGVDGSASNERGDLLFDVKQALLVARGRSGANALTAREALRLATRGSAAVLGREDLGCIEPGRCADLAVWRVDGLELGGAADPVAGLVLSAPHRVDRLVVGGEDVVRDGGLVHAAEEEIACDHRKQAERFAA